jgi:hypothetical protein
MLEARLSKEIISLINEKENIKSQWHGLNQTRGLA